MDNCSICNRGYSIENTVVVNAYFKRISNVQKEVLTPLQFKCQHAFHYYCISQKFHKEVSDKSKSLSCPTCDTIIGHGENNAPWGVYFDSNFEATVYLKEKDIFQRKEEKVDTFFIGQDFFTNVKGVFEAVD